MSRRAPANHRTTSKHQFEISSQRHTENVRKNRERAEKKKSLEEENRLQKTSENRLRSARKLKTLKDDAGPIARNWLMNIFAVIQVLAIIYFLTR